LALTRYNTLLVSDVPLIEKVRKSSFANEYDDVVVNGFRGERINFELDTLMMVDFKFPPPSKLSFASFISGEKVKSILLSRGITFEPPEWEMDWARLANYFPNLDSFYLVFGEFCGAPVQKSKNNQWLLKWIRTW
jgi:hypothetical protein